MYGASYSMFHTYFVVYRNATIMAYYNANTLRAISTFRPAWMVFAPSGTDRLVGELREAISRRDSYCTAYADACAKLVWANRTRPEYHCADEALAIRKINAARATIRARAKAVVAARTALLAADMAPEQIATQGPGSEAQHPNPLAARGIGLQPPPYRVGRLPGIPRRRGRGFPPQSWPSTPQRVPITPLVDMSAKGFVSSSTHNGRGRPTALSS